MHLPTERIEVVPLNPDEDWKNARRDVYPLPGQNSIKLRMFFRDFVGRYLSETEFSKAKLIYQNWERFVQNHKLPHRDPYLNVMEFIKQVVESLNRCEEKVKLEKLNIDRDDHPINRLDPRQRPVEYIKILRKENDRWQILDGMFPTDWRPELTIQSR